MTLLSRIVPSWLKRSPPAEGQYRPGPYMLSDGWLSATAGRFMNFWQMGYNVQPYGECGAMVEACISAYAQTVAMCPGEHWRKLSNGGRERVSTSALSRIMRRPNDYQSISDFMLNLTRSLYGRGEAFAVAIRNDRSEIAELHLMRHGYPNVATDGSIFYSLSGNEIIEQRFLFGAPVPARDVLHVRLHTPRHPLKGESPILSTALDRAMAGAALNQQVTYYLNQARPSFLLKTPLKLNAQQIEELHNRWDQQTKGSNSGGTPVLTDGLEATVVNSGTAKDAELAELLKMSDQNIALAFRLPLQVLGLGGTTFASTELLMQSWIASGLGFALNHIEEAFGQLFSLKGVPDEYLELDTAALLRSAFRERIEGYARAVITGISTINEARAAFDMEAKPHGDEPRVQQQVVPLSYGAAMKPPQPTPVKPPADSDSEEGDSEEGDKKDDDEARSAEDYQKQYFDEYVGAESPSVH